MRSIATKCFAMVKRTKSATSVAMPKASPEVTDPSRWARNATVAPLIIDRVVSGSIELVGAGGELFTHTLPPQPMQVTVPPPNVAILLLPAHTAHISLIFSSSVMRLFAAKRTT